MMKKLLAALPLITLLSNAEAQVPLIPHVYTADPSAHVWPNDPDTLWIYTSHDEPGTNTHKTMFSYHAFSTQDLVNWVDHGRILSVDDVPWASTMAWAIDAVYWRGKYYLVHCMKEAATGTTRTGLAVSEYPQGPFVDAGYIKGVDFGQDPALFVDDDGKPYLFWGAGHKLTAAQLTDDLRAIKEDTLVDLTPQLKEGFEGPWVHKYQGKYYLSYPGLEGGKWPQQLYYAVADKPLGPYTFQKIFTPKFKRHGSTNHGSIVKWKDKWISFHHGSHLSGGKGTQRSSLADWLSYEADGTIKTIKDPKGLGLAKQSNITIFLEAENAPRQGGKFGGTHVEDKKAGYSGEGYVTGFETNFNSVTVMAQVAKPMKADLTIRLETEKDIRADVFIGPRLLDKGAWRGNPIKKTDGWWEMEFKDIQLDAGDNRIRFQGYGAENLKVDWFKIVPKLKN